MQIIYMYRIIYVVYTHKKILLLKLQHLVLGKDYHMFVAGGHIQTTKIIVNYKRDLPL